MSRVSTAIAMSDIHLGKPENYLHINHPDYHKNRAALLELLKELGPQDQLILNGDIMDLSLAGWDQAYEDLKAFFEILADAGPYKRIVFIPGNHDHHYWRMLVEQTTIAGSIRHGGKPPSQELYPYCFVDVRFSTNENHNPSHVIINHLWPEDHEAPEFIVKYPHHLVRCGEAKDAFCLLFTHGHFFEPLFKPVNFIIEPAHLEELEAFNNIWLEAFDYDLGHAGRLTERVLELEDIYQTGGIRAQMTIHNIFNVIHKTLMEALHLSWWKSKILQRFLQYAAKQIPIMSMEKKGELFLSPLDDKLRDRIIHYIEKYVLDRYQKGKGKEYLLPVDKDIPTPFTFVYGHTHRPLMEPEPVMIQGRQYHIANTGGWLRSDHPDADGSNSGILVMDEAGAQWVSLQGKLS